MGYLSQRKRQKNIYELLTASLLILAVCCLLLCFFKEFTLTLFINKWLFQIYLYTLVMIVLALSFYFWKQAIGFIVIAFFLFLTIGAGSNLFFNVQTSGLQTIRLFYQPKVINFHHSDKQINRIKPDIAALITRPNIEIKNLLSDVHFPLLSEDGHIIMTPHRVSDSGELMLSPQGRAGFVQLNFGGTKLIFISLDLLSPSYPEKQIALKNLEQFINAQNIPVIIVGRFGMPAWSFDFMRFLEKTGLEVKNHILLSNGETLFNPFVAPSLMVLAYKDFGIRDISFLPAKGNGAHPLFIEMNY